MPKLNTHLHLGSKLSEVINIKDINSFLLGNVYPDCWNTSIEKSLEYHYKDTLSSFCNLESFKMNEEMNDFNLGYYFHLWIDNRILKEDIGDITKYDCLICDMPVIAPIICQFKEYKACGKEYQSIQNILELETEPMPLYLVSEEKKKRYYSILDKLVSEFVFEYFCDK